MIFEAGDTLAPGASGNDVGLYNPRFTAEFDAVGQFYSAAFRAAINVFEEFGQKIDWNPCGAIHLMTDEKKARRFPKTVESWGWPENEMRLVSAGEASEISGIVVTHDALYLPRSGTVSPKKLCHEYARNVDVRLGARVEQIDGDVTVLACGMGCLSFEQAAHLPLKAVRGQVSYIRESEMTRNLKTTIGYGGYIAPAQNGVHCLGATFQRWLDHSQIIEDDDSENLDNLFEHVPSLRADYEIAGHRAAVRTTSKDHFPVVGRLDERVYISAAHGSHGVLSSFLSAKNIANMILGAEMQLPDEVLKALDSGRFDSVGNP